MMDSLLFFCLYQCEFYLKTDVKNVKKNSIFVTLKINSIILWKHFCLL